MTDGKQKDIPAFPRDHRHDGHNGMSLRDYFAAKAMQAIVSTVPHLEMIRQDFAAIEAYQYADAMMKARGEA